MTVSTRPHTSLSSLEGNLVSDPQNVRVFGDSLGVGIEQAGAFQGSAKGGMPSNWILGSIRSAGETVANSDAILSTGASNDALNIVASWIERNRREGIELADDDVQAIKAGADYQRFLGNISDQIDTLFNAGARRIYVAGVLGGPQDIPNYLKHRSVGHAQGGVYNALGVNDDIRTIVSNYVTAHPEAAGKIVFGGPLNGASGDNIHLNDYQPVVSAANGFFHGDIGSGVSLEGQSIRQQDDKASVAPRAPMAAVGEDHVLTAADHGEALFELGSSSLGAEQERRLKAHFLSQLKNAQASGILSSLKVTLVGSADATGSNDGNNRLSMERAEAELRILKDAERDSGISLRSNNIKIHALGTQGTGPDPTKRRAAALFLKPDEG